MSAYRCFAALSMTALLAACANPSTSSAPSLIAPATLHFDGATYQQVFHHTVPGQATWEYTTNDESVQDWQWTTLLTIYDMQLPVSLHRWLAATVDSLRAETPMPHYDIKPNGPDEALVRIIYEPRAGKHQLGQYESDAWIVRAACGGIINLQFARQYPALAGEDRHAKLIAIKANNDDDMRRLQAMNWSPTCRAR